MSIARANAAMNSHCIAMYPEGSVFIQAVHVLN
jgi:hypothetical protein